MILVEGMQHLRSMVGRLREVGTEIALDAETTGLDPLGRRLVMLQLKQDGQTFIVDLRDAGPVSYGILSSIQHIPIIGHNVGFDWKFLAAQGVRFERVYDTAIAEQLLTSSGKMPKLSEVVAKYCKVTLEKDFREWFYSPAPLDERTERRRVGRKYLGYTDTGEDVWEDEYVEVRLWDEPFPDEALTYGELDVEYLHTIKAAQIRALREAGMATIAAVEMRCVPAIAQMELNGVHINVDGWRDIITEQEGIARLKSAELGTSELAVAVRDARMARFDEQAAVLAKWEVEKKAAEAASREEFDATNGGDPHTTQFLGWGEWKRRWMADWKAEHPRPTTPDKKLREVNLNSHQQLAEGLELLGVPVEDTEAETLKALVGDYPVLRPLLELRAAEKIVSTYGESLLSLLGPDGRIHPSFHQIGAETGRMSSSRPNWQNIPARTELGSRMRRCVTAAEGHSLIVADFSNIEMRILADMSGDAVLLQMFADGTDMHCFTARRMFNLPASMTEDEVKEYRLPDGPLKGLKARDVAKTINFGTVYGQSEYGFARKFGVVVDAARQFNELYYQTFPGLKPFLTRQARDGLNGGYSVTALGRRRYYRVPQQPGRGASREDEWEYKKAVGIIQRASMNHPIQGTSADITKLAVALFFERSGAEQRLVAVVHDELVVECHDDIVDHTKALLETSMFDAASAVLKRVYLPPVEAHVGTEWSH